MSSSDRGGGSDVTKGLFDSSGVLIIDGSLLEGGGQILRNSVALSALLCRRIEIQKIRAGRKKPGLSSQHLMGLRLVRDICQGQLRNDAMGSCEVMFDPGDGPKAGRYKADAETAGSVCLFMQVSVPCCLFSSTDNLMKSELRLFGGTDADFAPPVDYYNIVVLPTIAKMGVNVNCQLVRRGFFPRGGGECYVTVEALPAGQRLKPLQLTDRGKLIEIGGIAYCGGQLPFRVAEEMRTSAENIFRSEQIKNHFANNRINIQIEAVKETPQRAFGTGTGIVLYARTNTGLILGASGLGKRGVRATIVGETAAGSLLKTILSGATVDDHLQDQLIIFMALADGRSEMLVEEETLHTKTAIHIAQVFTKAEFEVKSEENGLVRISCKGVGFQRSQ